MRIFAVALKDIRHSFRTVFALVMMFVMPLLITGLFYLAFGNTGSGNLDIAVTKVQVVNLDKPIAQAGNYNAGQGLVDFLKDEKLAKLIEVTIAPDEATARAAVDSRKAGVLLVIPADFSLTIIGGQQNASLSFYQDPTLSLGPSIVRSLVTNYLDVVAGSKIAATAALQEASQHGVELDLNTIRSIAQQYTSSAQATSAKPLNLIITPPASKSAEAEKGASLIGGVMAGMMIFFVFYTGLNGSETILRENEAGTLARLFTTPVSRSVVLGGKFLAVLLMLLVQIAVLLVVSTFAFSIYWGQLLPIVIMTISTTLASAGFGAMVMSYIKNNKQSGAIAGGLLAITGMLGGLFTAGNSNLPEFFQYVNLLTPQGWALKGWRLTLAGEAALNVLPPALALAGLGLLFFTVGALVFRRRFA